LLCTLIKHTVGYAIVKSDLHASYAIPQEQPL